MRKVVKLSFFWKSRNKMSRLDLVGVQSCTRYPLYVRLSGQLKKGGGGHIGFMAIFLSLIILIITTNYRMIQPSNISCGGLIRVQVRK